jgi:hypothetical protein
VGWLRPVALRLLELPQGQGDRWIVAPIEFLRTALRLPDMPVPDVTTENGRRLMLVHVDGDGFMNRAEFRGTPYAGRGAAEGRAWSAIASRRRSRSSRARFAPNGLYPKDSPALGSVARRIFALPYVEIASHTYSHPFRWAKRRRCGPGSLPSPDPGYKFNLEAEIDGPCATSTARSRRRASARRCMLWTGDTNPGPQALERAQASGSSA